MKMIIRGIYIATPLSLYIASYIFFADFHFVSLNILIPHFFMTGLLAILKLYYVSIVTLNLNFLL